MTGRGALRTLVVSDLHLGAPSGRDVLRQPDPRSRLLDELGQIDRLVLLGDVLELRQIPWRVAMDAALPVLREIGQALGAGKQVVIVPGNHDHHLLSGWRVRRTRAGAPEPMTLQTEVDWRPEEPLAEVAAALGPAEVAAYYPGVWLRDDVYATHGHLADRHTTLPMLERVAAGAMARIVGEPPGGPHRVEDYEATLAPIYAWIHAVAQAGDTERGRVPASASTSAWQALAGAGEPRGVRRWRRRVLAAGFPLLIAALNRAGLGPLRSQLSGGELGRASLRALWEVMARLGVDADYVIFGHTHRAGPLSDARAASWRGPQGAEAINTGSWILEPAFLGSRPESSPYRAGFCVVVNESGPPELRNLLDRPGPDPG
ncbi:MAG: metallophosphoesterase [Solirubrobacteraceae bacterium]